MPWQIWLLVNSELCCAVLYFIESFVMIKRVFLVLSVSLVMSLTGCNGSSSDTNTSMETNTNTVTDVCRPMFS